MSLRTEMEAVRDPINHPDRFEELTADKQRALLGWIAESLVPTRRAGELTSYGLKHEFEGSLSGFYVTNGEFKGAMLTAGYSPVDENRLNWSFRYRIRKSNESGEPLLRWSA